MTIASGSRIKKIKCIAGDDNGEVGAAMIGPVVYHDKQIFYTHTSCLSTSMPASISLTGFKPSAVCI